MEQKWIDILVPYIYDKFIQNIINKYILYIFRRRFMRKHTMKEVAKEASVACSTVSRYINRSGYVDMETGERIAQAIAKLNYAVPMKEKPAFVKKKVIVLSVTDIGNPFYSVLARHIQTMLYEKGYTMVLFDSKDGKLELDAIKLAQDFSAQGLIVGTIHYSEDIKEAVEKASIPTVILNACADGNIDCVHVDGDMATYIATKHLLSLGHKHIVYAMEEYGLTPGPQDVLEQGLSQEAGYEMGRVIASFKKSPTAICCANDITALGVLSALQERGIKIPDDISVTGVDDIVFAQKFTPSLTTVSNKPRQFAEKAMALLFHRLEHNTNEEPQDLAVSHHLIMRASTAPPKESKSIRS